MGGCVGHHSQPLTSSAGPGACGGLSALMFPLILRVGPGACGRLCHSRCPCSR